MRLNNKGIESSRGFEQPSPEKIDDSENVSFAVDSQGYPCKDNSTTLNRFRVPKLLSNGYQLKNINKRGKWMAGPKVECILYYMSY